MIISLSFMNRRTSAGSYGIGLRKHSKSIRVKKKRKWQI